MIELRAWFTKAKAMVPVDSLEMLGNGHFMVSARHEFEKGGWYTPLKECTNRKTVVDDSKIQVPRVILMQYTGIKDMNDKKIFEGDLFNYRCGGTKQAKPYIVESAFKLWEDIGLGQGDGYYSMSNFEIIGNIHQDKHLLEDSQ